MTHPIFDFPAPFLTKTAKKTIPIDLLTEKQFKGWEKKKSQHAKTQIAQGGFTAGIGQTCILRGKNGDIESFAVGVPDRSTPYDIGPVFDTILKAFSEQALKKAVFSLSSSLSAEAQTNACIGWGWSCYRFDRYKASNTLNNLPKLVWPSKADKKRAAATIESVCLIRELVNTPSNDLGTDELAAAAQHIAKTFKAKFKTIEDEDLLKQNFPLIYAVGKASDRRPKLIEMNWGQAKHPKVTIVGKGIVFDTGGLNIKPGRAMALMKKDMGGSAQALGLAWMIMSMKLPIRLRVLIPAAENSISSNAFRPGDILTSRKGLSVEIGDTDAEGRLVVADALAYACEGKPDLLIDFCTLTGAARVALGFDIPAYFSNNEKIIDSLKPLGMKTNDPVWPLPLWDAYEKDISTPNADVFNDGKGMAGAIYGGLFLRRFVDPSIDWVHLDCYAWEQSGRPGRPQGGADTGMRAVFKLIESRYAG